MHSSKHSSGNVDMTRAKKMTLGLLVIYAAVLLWILLFKLGVEFSYMEKRYVNFIPFTAPQMHNGNIDYAEMILNMLIFVPLGIYASVLFKQMSFGKKVVLFFLTSLIFETIQFIFKIGAFDITDIITNTTGGIIGLMFYKVIEAFCTDRSRTHHVINVFASIGTFIVIAFLILLKLEMLPIRYQ